MKRNFHFSESERSIGKKLSNLITKYYKISDTQVSKGNFITYLFIKIRDFFSCLIDSGYNTRFHWEVGDDDETFDLYTKTQYVKVFKYLPPGDPQKGQSGCPGRWYAAKSEND